MQVYLVAAEITSMADAWQACAESEDEYVYRFVRELSEPIQQRILQPDDYISGSQEANLQHIYLSFWPNRDEHAVTSILNAIMQVGLPEPCCCLLGRKCSLDPRQDSWMIYQGFHSFPMVMCARLSCRTWDLCAGHCGATTCDHSLAARRAHDAASPVQLWRAARGAAAAQAPRPGPVQALRAAQPARAH